MKEQVENTIDNLRKHNINCYFVEDEEKAREKILELIKPNKTVGLGGSMTVHSIKVIPELEKRNIVFNPYNAEGRIDRTKNQPELRRNGLLADYYLTGTNAVTEDGYLVNTDGTGNRVAAMAYGPKKLILVTGVNKITENLDAAFNRIKTVAAPLNARRHGWEDIPCYDTECDECASSHRQCNSSLIIHHSRDPERVSVILVNKDLGF